jgi:hypothetical protein
MLGFKEEGSESIQKVSVQDPLGIDMEYEITNKSTVRKYFTQVNAIDFRSKEYDCRIEEI